ncbi:MAG: hypothetical protein DME68_07785 [Verrucomicrobia bacterium]|nr:MAG: hypothetical protein DME68_07785 [Verrucomicrobiota bacterium]
MLAQKSLAWHKTTLARFESPKVAVNIEFMPTATPSSRDAALETRVFWERFKTEIIAVLIIAVLAILGFAGYRFYSDRRAAAASALLARAKSAEAYQEVIVNYPNTPASADACLLLAEAQRNQRKFTEATATLQVFINKNPNHEFVSTAKMAMAANLESMGKNDEALSIYQQIASIYPNNFNAPLALLSQVYLLKSKNRIEEARRVCETILTRYRESFWAGEAAQELRLFKPTASSQLPPAQPIPPFLAVPSSTPAAALSPNSPKPK